MSSNVVEIENLSKLYRLGEVGTGSLSDDLKRWWAKLRGNEDPFSIVGGVNDRNSSESLDYVWALRDISFNMQPGDVLGVIGKNGAGKSTLLKLISRITAPTKGSIKVKGRIASLLEVGTGMNIEMTARENIFLNGAILGMKRAEIAKKFDEIIDFAGCTSYVDTPIKRFSSGMRVRLGFAVAAFLEPDILIVDEVLAVGDAEFQKKAVGKIKDVSENSGRTVLFVSHNMSSVKRICNRGIVLKQGQHVYSGTANEAVDFYMSQYGAMSNAELSERTDRMGGDRFRFISIRPLNSKGKEVSEAISGEELNIEICMKKMTDIVLQKVIFSIVFFDKYENRALAFSSEEMGFEMADFPTGDTQKVNLKIPQLLLRADSYYLRIMAFNDGRSGVENILDHVTNALTLNVSPGDFWDIGKPNRPGNFAIINAEYEQSSIL